MNGKEAPPSSDPLSDDDGQGTGGRGLQLDLHLSPPTRRVQPR
jgi:hypothetical protein